MSCETAIVQRPLPLSGLRRSLRRADPVRRRYTYNLGLAAGSLIADGRTGYMAAITGLLSIERRHGQDEFVIEKALVKMDSPAMAYFVSRGADWSADDLFASPGPRQLWGPSAYQQPVSVALNSKSDSLAFKIG